ncbi:hypothetical protein SHL15_0049 [Streptomyces hygroscopicus subsp. limoneus]|nr:hypothetical protein SHL15_0049 [Streptomyces hygroscopicus subsp. limoneus]
MESSETGFLLAYARVQLAAGRRERVSALRDLASWRGFVNGCAAGYDDVLPEYVNDLWVRDSIEQGLVLDDGVRQLAILTAGPGVLREHTPGEPAVDLMHAPAVDAVRLRDRLASCLCRRYAQAAQGLELGWVAAAAPWACPLRALTAGYPPPSVLDQSLQCAGGSTRACGALANRVRQPRSWW